MSGQPTTKPIPRIGYKTRCPGSRPAHQPSVLAHPGKHRVALPLPRTKDVLSLSALVSKRAW